jgi:hypothetical protein
MRPSCHLNLNLDRRRHPNRHCRRRPQHWSLCRANPEPEPNLNPSPGGLNDSQTRARDERRKLVPSQCCTCASSRLHPHPCPLPDPDQAGSCSARRSSNESGNTCGLSLYHAQVRVNAWPFQVRLMVLHVRPSLGSGRDGGQASCSGNSSVAGATTTTTTVTIAIDTICEHLLLAICERSVSQLAPP